MKLLLTISLIAFSISGFSQRTTSNYNPGTDPSFLKIVTRTITISGNENPLLQVPVLETSFTNILLTGINTGAIKAYSPDNDSLALTPQLFTALLKTNTVIGSAKLIPDSVKKLIIKEEWTFQRDIGRMVIRITHLTPVIKVVDSAGVIRETPAFWLHYSDIRAFFASQKVAAGSKNKKIQNLRDVMDGRNFKSEVVASSNKLQ